MNVIDTIWPYLLVFVLAAVPFLEAFTVIPLAMIAGLSTLPVIIIALIGNIATVLLLIIFIEKIKEWRKKRKKDEEKEEGKRAKRAKRLWSKYGLPGLALIGPFFVGSHLTTFMCLTLGGAKMRTAYWMMISIIFWAFLMTVLVYFGIDFLGFSERENIFK